MPEAFEAYGKVCRTMSSSAPHRNHATHRQRDRRPRDRPERRRRRRVPFPRTTGSARCFWVVVLKVKTTCYTPIATQRLTVSSARSWSTSLVRHLPGSLPVYFKQCYHLERHDDGRLGDRRHASVHRPGRWDVGLIRRHIGTGSVAMPLSSTRVYHSDRPITSQGRNPAIPQSQHQTCNGGPAQAHWRDRDLHAARW